MIQSCSSSVWTVQCGSCVSRWDRKSKFLWAPGCWWVDFTSSVLSVRAQWNDAALWLLEHLCGQAFLNVDASAGLCGAVPLVTVADIRDAWAALCCSAPCCLCGAGRTLSLLHLSLPQCHFIIFAFYICSKAVFYLDQTCRPETFSPFETKAENLLFLNVKFLLYLDRFVGNTHCRTCRSMCWSSTDWMYREEEETLSSERRLESLHCLALWDKPVPFERGSCINLRFCGFHSHCAYCFSSRIRWWKLLFFLSNAVFKCHRSKRKTKSMSWSVQ